MYLDRTFAQEIGSAKIKSKSKVTEWPATAHVIAINGFGFSTFCTQYPLL